MPGFIIFDKPEGVTSFTAANIVRKIAKEKKAGHTGTLDPLATGVLPVALGSSTRFINYLRSSDKSYRASFILGEKTDTYDITGKVIEKREKIPPENEVKSALKNFLGEIKQKPPMYSAVKIDGERLYKLARRGIETDRPERLVVIYSIDFVSHLNDEYTIDIKCSKGAYIRSVINDLGELLGAGAVMTKLRRTYSNGFSLESAHTEEELKSSSDVNKFIIPPDKALDFYPYVKLSKGQSTRFKNGGELYLERIPGEIAKGLQRVYSFDDVFLGLGENSDNIYLKPKVVINDG